VLPGWYGLGAALETYTTGEARGNRLREMYQRMLNREGARSQTA